MATSSRQLDHTEIEAKIFDITRTLLNELGNRGATMAVRGSAHLERDLGLGSLERVELFLRIDRAFGKALPEDVVARADTVGDLIAALIQVSPAAPPQSGWAERTAEERPPAKTGAAAPVATETWQEVLRYRALNDADRPHIILWENGAESQRISFAELYGGALAVARKLAQRGITRGDTVALMLPTSREFFMTFAGILLAGGVPAPIYPPIRADRIAEYAERQSAILRNAEARLLVTFQEAALAAKLLRTHVPSLRGIVTAAALVADDGANAAGSSFEPVRARGGDLALLQYTSGSTGNPKGVMLTHANLLANVRAMGEAAAMGPDDVGISWLPLYHDMGLIGAWLTPLYFGLPVVVLSPISFLTRPEQWLRAIERNRGTLTAAPNFAYELALRKIADTDIAGLDLSTLRAALNGAEPVNASTLERFAERFARYGLRREALTPVYGLAESSLAVTMPPLGRGPRVDRVARETFEREGRALPAPPASLPDDPSVLAFVSVGAPLSNHEVRIVDATGQSVGERVEGALWFRGPSATSGYFRNEEDTRALFPEGRAAAWLDSGDRAYYAGSEIFITGRTKDIVVKAGRNLYPHEIEEIAGRVPGVRKGCVVAFGAADATTGTERLIVAAEAREQDANSVRRIVAAITEQVAMAIGMPPDAVELLAPHSIPKTSSGKLRRDEARKLYLKGMLGAATAPAWLQVTRLEVLGAARATGARLLRGLELLYGVYAALVFVLWLLPTWLLVRLAPNRQAAAGITSPAIGAYFKLVGCRLRVEGREHIVQPGPRVFVSNHASYFDVLALMAALGIEYHFVAKQEVHSMPFIGTFLRKLGHFAFDRSDPRERLHQAEQIESALRRGESVFVFPEGTFTSQEGIRPFQLGAFKAAAETQCPVVPVALCGTRRFLRDETYLPRPAHVTITVCPPLVPQAVSPSKTWPEIVRLRDAAREAIGRFSREPLL